MILNYKQLIDLPVYTEKGQHLGRISCFDINSTAQNIVKYYVKPESFIKELIAKELIIDAGQVISIDKNKMVVEENVVKAREKMKKTQLAENNLAVPLSSTINLNGETKL